MNGMWDFKFLKKMNREVTLEEKLIDNINSALADIYSARTDFDMATGDDNIELAIYRLSTAELKYRNLIREAKRLGVLRAGIPSRFKEEVEENQCS